MAEILLVIQVMITLALVIIILLQQTSSDGLSGLGGGSGGGHNFLSSRSSANLLTRTTAILATAFMVNSLVLAILASQGGREESILDQYSETPAISGAEEPVTNEEKPQDSFDSAPLAQ